MDCLTCLSICILSLPCWSSQSSPCALLGQRFYLCSSNLSRTFFRKAKAWGSPRETWWAFSIFPPQELCWHQGANTLILEIFLVAVEWTASEHLFWKIEFVSYLRPFGFLQEKKKILNICHSSKKDSSNDPKEQNLKQKNAQRIWMVYRKGSIQEKLNPTLKKVNAK